MSDKLQFNFIIKRPGHIDLVKTSTLLPKMTARAFESARIAQKMIKQTAENVVSFAYEVIREQANITKLVS